MSETEASKKISNKEMLVDIENTRREKEAYDLLAEGFETLAKLPENIASGQANVQNMEAIRYSRLSQECQSFYLELQALARERGLDDQPPMCGYCHTRHYGYQDHEGA